MGVDGVNALNEYRQSTGGRPDVKAS